MSYDFTVCRNPSCCKKDDKGRDLFLARKMGWRVVRVDEESGEIVVLALTAGGCPSYHHRPRFGLWNGKERLLQWAQEDETARNCPITINDLNDPDALADKLAAFLGYRG